eukprot:CAMPEP_0185018392 /NCGR_PEP_ID=MMETSP1103-20130426/1131_1 /TAXON_ID=36769 /ORGANISM="Paraphysomonas bandaiensis, Strain Caron Lab Isolate" /LENGTH=183 /DNA_ID=CAMNT_0027548189 /DNA_START=109 /DNA_END=660 /DNA_ORIENTATION=-
MLVKPSSPRCVGQELDQEDAATFFIRPVGSTENGNIQTIQVSISDPEGGILLEDSVHSGEVREISKNIALRGVYQMCFANNGDQAMHVIFYVSFKNRGVERSKKIDKNIPSVERKLLSAELLLQDISHEIDFAKRQESALMDVIDATNARIAWFSYLSMFVLLGTAAWQLIYLRNFFTSKKLL